MSTAKHSKLPWKVSYDEPFGRPQISTGSEYVICLTVEGITAKISEANAALIVKSVNLLPELVAALEDAASGLSVLADDSGLESRAENVRSQVEQIRELLARARQ